MDFLFFFQSTFFISLYLVPVGPNQVESAAARLGGEHEDELGAGGIVELVHHLGPLLDGHGAVQAHVAVATQSTELLKHIQGLGVVGHKHNLKKVKGSN